jgi:hypothetical protein
MVSNNLTNLSGIYPQYQILPTDDMGRQIMDVTIEDNTGVVTGALGTFLDILGDSPAGALSVKNNLFSAPDLVPGVNMAASVFIAGNSPAAVALFSHNIWAAPSPQYTEGPGAVNYIAPSGVLAASGYLTAAQWNALPNVQDDQFEAVTVSVNGFDLQLPIGGQMAGAVLPPTLS